MTLTYNQNVLITGLVLRHITCYVTLTKTCLWPLGGGNYYEFDIQWRALAYHHSKPFGTDYSPIILPTKVDKNSLNIPVELGLTCENCEDTP